ncbi:MAG TPA: diaminopimelate epimerase [Candidatus Latescibacteria bacterium]|nr:diaminopimelate epimerase [Candidatus Latescibacterota bacterium]
MARLKFTKMTGAGNDFIVFDSRDGKIPEDRSEFVRRICQRRLSIGADGVLIVEASDKADFKMRYYNADGGEAEMCGNGGRCVSRYAYLKKIAPRKMTFETIAGLHYSEVVGEDVRLRMLDPHDINLRFGIELNEEEVTVNFANTGVPHVVLFVDNVSSVDVRTLGERIRNHKKFMPEGTNANFVQIIDPNHIKVRTYERGVEGETLACGTGVVAAAVIGGLLGRLKSPAEALTQSGITLKVHFDIIDNSVKNVFLEGDAKIIFEGVLVN